ncbi:SGNH hydrolase domain-containing protein [Microbacterium sp. NPDC055521]
MRKAVFRADVQGLRMVAVLAVIADHLLHWPAGGFVGVDIFFVISGFLITGLLLREQEKTGTISFWGFYRRRIKRILPAATLVVVLTVIASFALLSRVRATGAFWDGVWASLFSANWHFAADGTDYFQPDVAVSPLQHYWSLSVEEQYYFVWPWLMLLIFWLTGRMRGDAASRSAFGIRMAILLVVVVSFAWSMWETVNAPTWAYFSTLSRAWELGIGAAVAVFSRLFVRIPAYIRPLLAWAGLVGIGVSLVVVTSASAFPAPWAALPVLSTALVIIAGTGGEARYLWPLTNRVSTYIGDISYSLYLWHWPIIVLLAVYLPLDTLTNQAIALALIGALSIASFHLIEDPIRRSTWLDPDARTARRLPRGWLRHGPIPKIVALALTSVVTAGMTAWALAPRTDARVSPPEVVFIGDSYTAGIGSEGPDWPTTVAAALGWKAENLAAGGTGYATEAGMEGCGKEHCGAYLEQSTSISGKPDIIVVAGGRNDANDAIGAAALELFTALRTKHPDAEIIALSPWADDDTPSEGFTAKSAAVAKAADDAGVTYIDTGQPFVGHADLISADGVHPNAAGYAQLASILIPELAAATGQTPPTDVAAITTAAARQDQVREALRAKKWPELTPAVDELGDDARVPEWVKDHCLDVDDRNVDECGYGDANAAEGVALLGDSHAISYMPTLRGAFPDRRIQSLTLQQCPAAAVTVQVRTSQGSSPYPECDAHRVWAEEWIDAHKPKTVVIVDTWDTPTRMPGDDTVAELREYKSALTALIGRLSEKGARVVVLASPPPGENLVDCKTPASTPADCVRTMPRTYSEWTKVGEDAVAGADAPGAVFVRTDPWFCSTGSCPAFVGAIATFADGNHLTDAAARAVSPLLLQSLSAQ